MVQFELTCQHKIVAREKKQQIMISCQFISGTVKEYGCNHNCKHNLSIHLPGVTRKELKNTGIKKFWKYKLRS
jgi:hypothetical protein